MKRFQLSSLLGFTAAIVFGLLVVAGPAGATGLYFGLLPADKTSQGCNFCHNGAPTKDSLTDLGKKVATAAPKTKEDMAKLLSPATAPKAEEKPAAPAPSGAAQAEKPAAEAAKPAGKPAATNPAASTTRKLAVSVGAKKTSLQGPVIKGRLLIPVRELADLVGAQVEWDAARKAATFTTANGKVVLTAGQSAAVINGEQARMDVAALISSDRILAPIRFVAEALGYSVDYGAQGITLSPGSRSAAVGGSASATATTAVSAVDLAAIKSQLIDKSGALPGYVGTQVCKTCHSDKYNAWLTTGHSRHVRDVSQPGATSANFAAAPSIDASNLLFAIGGLTKQYFVDKDYNYVGLAWDQENVKWVDNAGLAGANYIERCASCHTVGFNPQTKKAVDLNIGCESCHGPGELHVAGGGDKTKIQISLGNDTCGKCHSDQQKQLESMGEEWARDGIPRDGHSNHFKNLLETRPTYSDSCTKCHSVTVFLAKEKGLKPPVLDDFKTGSYQNDRLGITCVVCHSPHERTQEAQLRKAPQETCTQCHTADKPVVAGSKVSHAQEEFFEGKGIGVEVPAPKSAECIDCHMAKGNHVFKPGTPIATFMVKGKPAEATPCAQCHSNSLTAEEIAEKQEFVAGKYAELNTNLKAKQEKFKTATDLAEAAKPVIQAKLDAILTNLSLISGDGTDGIHNYPFAKALLEKAAEDLSAVDKLLP